jgi:trans-2,3-dihydro-3-hydroxyanthranilate isomerase
MLLVEALSSASMTASRSFRFELVDVFAARPLEGNLLAVVLDADEVSTATMLRLAGRLRLSETSFVQAPTTPRATYRHRIFTIAQEIPFAGHPSLGTAAVVVRARGERQASVVQETGEGLQRLRVSVDRDRARVDLEQSPATFGAEIDAASLMAAFGLRRVDARRGVPAQLVSTGLPTLVILLADADALDRATVDWPAITSLVERHADVSFLNLYLAAEAAPGRWAARCFGQDIAGGEDPATGSAAGPLGAYLASRLAIERFEIDQGVAMGQPSRISVSVDGTRPTVSGDVWFRASGTIDLPGGGRRSPSQAAPA